MVQCDGNDSDIDFEGFEITGDGESSGDKEETSDVEDENDT